MKNTAAKFPALFLALLGTFSSGVARAQNQTAAPPPASASAPSPDEVIPELTVNGKVYQDVRVNEITPTSIVIFYRGGIASIALADLPPDLQQRFGYNPGQAAAELARQKADADARRAHEESSPLAGEGSPDAADRILESFGQPPKVFEEVNMRPRFELLGIDAKNQGARPSCAVFAVVSALEYQQSPPDGPAPSLSEEYLIWATLKTLGQAGIRLPKTDVPGFDVGFSLVEVIQALRAYGIALESELPYHVTADNPVIYEPNADVIASAKLRSPVNGYIITGREPAMQIANLVQALNQGVPVIVGLKWPSDAAVNNTGVLDNQTDMDKGAHAVVIVGYRTSTGRIEDAQFLFKNSYGVQWGDHGYGIATYNYLMKNLEMAMFMDVR
ncbi:MAG: C1 family peptidase [Opitutales bacterium]|jgi:hypothetical protein